MIGVQDSSEVDGERQIKNVHRGRIRSGTGIKTKVAKSAAARTTTVRVLGTAVKEIANVRREKA